jgi:hypothetical protein
MSSEDYSIRHQVQPKAGPGAAADARLAEARRQDEDFASSHRLSKEEFMIAKAEFDAMDPEQKDAILTAQRIADPQRGNAADPRAHVEQGSVLSRIKSPMGVPRGSFDEVKPTDIITIEGLQTSLGVALRMGAVVYNPRTGEYTQGEQVAAAEKVEQNAGVVRDHLAPDFHAAVEELGVLTDGKATATIGSIISQTVAADGDVTKAAEQLASRIGGEIDYSRTVIQNAIASGTKTAAEYISRSFPGVDGAAVLAHASTVGTKSERASRINRVVLGDKSVFSEMVAAYKTAQRREEYGTKFPRRNG